MLQARPRAFRHSHDTVLPLTFSTGHPMRKRPAENLWIEQMEKECSATVSQDCMVSVLLCAKISAFPPWTSLTGRGFISKAAGMMRADREYDYGQYHMDIFGTGSNGDIIIFCGDPTGR